MLFFVFFLLIIVLLLLLTNKVKYIAHNCSESELRKAILQSSCVSVKKTLRLEVVYSQQLIGKTIAKLGLRLSVKY